MDPERPGQVADGAAGDAPAARPDSKPAQKKGSLPDGSLAGGAAALAAHVASGAEGASNRRVWGLKVLLGGLVAAAVGGVLAAVMPEFLRLPAVALAGLGGVVAYVGLWALVLGDRIGVLLEALTGKVTGMGCLIVFGSVAVPLAVFGVIMAIVNAVSG